MQLDLLMPAPLAMVNANLDRFPASFLAYLPENLPVYAAFEREALFADALRVREWDDAPDLPDARIGSLGAYRTLIEGLVSPSRRR